MNVAIRRYAAPFAGRPLAAFGLVIIAVVILCAAFAPWIAPFPPEAIAPTDRLRPPDAAHWFGTDHFGRDTFSRVVYGSRLALLIGVGVVSFALVTGVPIGILSALYPRLGRVLMRVVDVLMAFPSLLLALGLIVILGQGVTNAILAIGVIYLTTTARIVYGVTLAAARGDLRRGGAQHGRRHALDDPQAHPAQHGLAASGAGELRFRLRAARRGVARFSRPRRAAGRAELGQHAGGSRGSSSPARRGCCSFRAPRSR